MRDPKRIDKFCDEFGSIWKDNVPDWRFGQLISNFEYWLNGNGIDMFFPEEKEMLRLFKEFLGVNEDETKIEESISNLRLIFEPPYDSGEYEKWNSGVQYIHNIYLHGKLEKIAHIDRCGVVGKYNFTAIKKIKDKEKLNVEVIINNTVYPAILYVWRQNSIKGLIVATDDSDDEKKYAEKMWTIKSRIL